VIAFEAVVALFPDLGAAEIERWIDCRWVQPEEAKGGWMFHDIDVARVRLIYDIRYVLAIAEDVVPVVLSLIDQVYELRGALHAVEGALAEQPAEVRDAVRAALHRNGNPA
jgi:chaperone modulatory protein CbpM